MVPFLFSSLYRVISEFPRNLYFLGPSICHISAAECHRITNYGSKFSGERVLTEYSKIQWVLFMYKEFYLFIFFFFNLVHFLFWRNLFISFYFPCSVPVYLSYAHVYTLITRQNCRWL
jgi:hypothetical protein